MATFTAIIRGTDATGQAASRAINNISANDAAEAGAAALDRAKSVSGWTDLRVSKVRCTSDLDDPRETPQPITAEEWFEQLNMLPPMDWRMERGAEGFTCSEPYDSTRHWRFIRIGEHQWKVLASPRTSIADLAAQCIARPTPTKE